MDIKIVNQLQSNNEDSIPTIIKDIDINQTVKEFKLKVYKELNITIPLNNIGIFYSSNENDRKNKISLSEDNKQLIYYDNISNENTIFYIKNIGSQISYKLVYLIEYLGPLFFTLLFFYRLYYNKSKQKLKIPFIQIIYFIMAFFHYSKRVYETLFIHIFSHDTMPLKNLFKNCAYYWGIYGILCCYFIFHPNYNIISLFLYLRYLFGLLFFYAEYKNFKCHIILKELKEKNNGKKGIPPEKDGFQYCTCANYFWEFLSWLSFSFLSLHWSIILFTCCGFYQMSLWALKKNKILKELYPNEYPKGRKSFIPYLI